MLLLVSIFFELIKLQTTYLLHPDTQQIYILVDIPLYACPFRGICDFDWLLSQYIVSQSNFLI